MCALVTPRDTVSRSGGSRHTTATQPAPVYSPRAGPQPRLACTPGLLPRRPMAKPCCKLFQTGSSHCSLFPDRINELQTACSTLFYTLENSPQPPLLLIAFTVCQALHLSSGVLYSSEMYQTGNFISILRREGTEVQRG